MTIHQQNIAFIAAELVRAGIPVIREEVVEAGRETVLILRECPAGPLLSVLVGDYAAVVNSYHYECGRLVSRIAESDEIRSVATLIDKVKEVITRRITKTASTIFGRNVNVVDVPFSFVSGGQSFTAEFDGGYDSRCRGLKRLVDVHRYGVNVRIHVQGEHPISANLGFVTLSDNVHPLSMWTDFLHDLVVKSPGFRIVRGTEF